MQKYERVHNFNPGPAAVPLEVLERVREGWFNLNKGGMNVMEMSHRSKEYEAIHNHAIAIIRDLLGIGEDYHVLFLQGGASLQFAMIPMNFLAQGETADYIDTGNWSSKAIAEAKLFGNVHLPFDGKAGKFTVIPKSNQVELSANARYLHVTSNNTIEGTQFWEFPETGLVPLVCDMSSDIMSRRFDAGKFSLIYAGAQKNLGPSGVTLVILRDDFFKMAKSGNPTMLDYRTHVKENSLFNTPNTFGIFFMSCVLDWIKSQGGLAAIEKVNRHKATALYDCIDNSGGYYRGTCDSDSRSWMNVTYRLPSEALEERFVKESKAAGLVGLKGYRTVGGIRASLYNAVTLEAVKELTAYMKQFQAANPA